MNHDHHPRCLPSAGEQAVSPRLYVVQSTRLVTTSGQPSKTHPNRRPRSRKHTTFESRFAGSYREQEDGEYVMAVSIH